MDKVTNLLHALPAFFQAMPADAGRLLTTLLVLVSGFLLSRVWSGYLIRSISASEPEKLRSRLVMAKNIVWVSAILLIVTLWSSKIAGVILSLAAVAGASLIVSKELLMCILGYAMLTATRAYRVGDFIEITGLKGKVIDIHIFSTTLAETGVGHQMTGRTLSVPNSSVLSNAVRNISATGMYVVNILSIMVPLDIDMPKAEEAALEAAEEVTIAWQAAANSHFEHIEGRDFVDLPSSKPKVLWQSVDSKSHSLSIRFCSPMSLRVTAEQDIYRRFWARYKASTVAQPSPTSAPD